MKWYGLSFWFRNYGTRTLNTFSQPLKARRKTSVATT